MGLDIFEICLAAIQFGQKRQNIQLDQTKLSRKIHTGLCFLTESTAVVAKTEDVNNVPCTFHAVKLQILHNSSLI